MAQAGPKKDLVRDPRELAVKMLMEIEERHLLVPQASLQVPSDIKLQDRQLCNEMVYGTLRFLPGLEKVLLEFCPKPTFPQPIRWLLLVSLYQMGFMRIPNYAIVNEAIAIAKRMKMGGLRGLLNGVLRNAARRGDALWPKEINHDWVLPPWMWARFKEQYGEAIVSEWANVWTMRPETSYWSMQDGLEGDSRSENLPHGYRHSGQFQGEGLLKEKCYVQNESSQAIAELVCALKPESVLDLCAAPGGKACYIAAFANPKRLVACDISGERLATVVQNRDRLGLSFETLCLDGSDPAEIPSGNSFDVVLVDAPCSGLGIIGRHPELKIHKAGPAPKSLRDLQQTLMIRGYERVKPGGYLVFAVCSLDQAELPKAPENSVFDREMLRNCLPAAYGMLLEDRLIIAPSKFTDGFQAVLLKKPYA